MRSIMPGIISLIQHQEIIKKEPGCYRPKQCPKCGKCGLWCHGYYERKADYERCGKESLNPVYIPRFYCPHCRTTCSVVPECIAPQRHYPWLHQQDVLQRWIAGASYQKISQQTKPSRWTISRWIRRLKSQFFNHFAHLRSLLSSFGRVSEFVKFWRLVLEKCSLSWAMMSLNDGGVIIP